MILKEILNPIHYYAFFYSKRFYNILDIINRWAHQWKMVFNPDPTKQATEVLFSCMKSSPNHPQLIFNGTFVAKVNEQKHLGLILKSTLSFKKHLNGKIVKAKMNIGLIKHLSKFLPLKALDQMYKALVRSHLDYRDIIYHIPSLKNQPSVGVTLSSLMAKVFSTKQLLPLLVYGKVQAVQNFMKSGKSLSDRRTCRRILQIHNIIDNKTPSYLKDKLPPIRAAWYNPNHNCDIFQELRSRSNRYMYSFFPDATTSWNNIMQHFQNTSPFNTLKDHIISLVRPKSKSIYAKKS